MESKKIKVLAIVGPTASGKTRLSVELAKRFNGEIISADSMQIYKGMDIGTAKPTKAEMQGVRHHLVDFLDASKSFSVADYVELAKKCIENINSRGKLPIIAGGTGLYVDSLLAGVNFTKEKTDDSLRKKLKSIAESEGAEVLLRELESFDPETAKKLHPNNVLRIIRAIEMYKTTGITMSEQARRTRKAQRPYDDLIIGLNFKDRGALYSRINDRVDTMIKQGLEAEAREALASNCSITAMNAICYKELKPYICGDESLDSAVESIKTGTRRYAKRQLTWFKRNDKINWVNVDEYNSFEEILNKCTKTIELWKNICYNTIK